MVNWNFGRREKSLRYFAGRGHHQIIAGYYDSPLENVTRWVKKHRLARGLVAEGVCQQAARTNHHQTMRTSCNPVFHAPQVNPLMGKAFPQANLKPIKEP